MEREIYPDIFEEEELTRGVAPPKPKKQKINNDSVTSLSQVLHSTPLDDEQDVILPPSIKVAVLKRTIFHTDNSLVVFRERLEKEIQKRKLQSGLHKNHISTRASKEFSRHRSSKIDVIEIMDDEVSSHEEFIQKTPQKPVEKPKGKDITLDITKPKMKEKPKKEPKSTELKNSHRDHVNKFMETLPKGWTVQWTERKSGVTAGREDAYFISPEGKKYRSQVEVKRFLGMDAPPPKSKKRKSDPPEKEPKKKSKKTFKKENGDESNSQSTQQDNSMPLEMSLESISFAHEEIQLLGIVPINSEHIYNHVINTSGLETVNGGSIGEGIGGGSGHIYTGEYFEEHQLHPSPYFVNMSGLPTAVEGSL